MSSGSLRIPSWFVGVVVSYASLGDLSHLVVGNVGVHGVADSGS